MAAAILSDVGRGEINETHHLLLLLLGNFVPWPWPCLFSLVLVALRGIVMVAYGRFTLPSYSVRRLDCVLLHPSFIDIAASTDVESRASATIARFCEESPIRCVHLH